MNERGIGRLDQLVDDIANHSYEKHVVENKEFGFGSDPKYGQSLNIKTEDEYKQHIRDMLESDETRCFKVNNGVEKGTSYFYNEPSNTMIVVPGESELAPTCYRPPNGLEKFEQKINKTTYQQGYAPEIKQGIYELMPELKIQKAQEVDIHHSSSLNTDLERKKFEQLRQHELPLELEDNSSNAARRYKPPPEPPKIDKSLEQDRDMER